MTVLPNEYHSALTQLLENLLSTDNTIRAEAEKSLDQNWTSKDNVELLLVFLAEQACQGNNDTIRAFASVMFRRMAIKSRKNCKVSLIEQLVLLESQQDNKLEAFC